jgi:glycosyltransferase involved in cell wall biosynthesis
MMKILFLSTRRNKPSFRFRVEKMIPAFLDRGHRCDVDFLPRRVLERLAFYRRLSRYDVVFIQKRLLSRAELFVLRSRSQKLVYDFDDAVMYDSNGISNARRSSRFGAMARAADLVISGNSYLAEQATRYTPRVCIVPTTVDTEVYQPRSKKPSTGPVTLGWTGSSSTNRYLNELLPVLAGLKGRIELKLISDNTEDLDFGRLGSVPYKAVGWTQANEVEQAATFDVGLMPLPDDAWTRGKCGFKALQYMGLGIPAVCSPVGVNREIIEHNVNGYLAGTPEDWHKILTKLIADPQERARTGRAGRSRVRQAYALNVQSPRMVQILEDLWQPARQSA